MIYSENPLIRTLRGLKNSVLYREVSLLERFILTEIKALVTESTVLIRGGVLLRGVSANRGITVQSNP